MALAGYLEKHGIHSEIIDITLKEQIRDRDFVINKNNYRTYVHNQILCAIKKARPDVIGITCYTPEYYEVIGLARNIKKIIPKTTIIVGGIHPTLFPQEFCSPSNPIDIAVIGEGEITMLELVNALRNKTSLQKIKGIAFCDPKNKIMIQTPLRPLHPILDEIYNPAYDKVDMEYYTTASPYAIRGVFLRSAYVSYSRGCPSQCTFCVSKKIRTCNGIGNYIRLRDPKNVADEISFLKQKYKIDSFYFIDDLFTLDKSKVKTFCKILIENRINLLWGCSSKVTTVDFQTLKIMKKAGCIQIDFGVERGSDQALKLVKKGTNLRIIKNVFNNCHKLGIRTLASMIDNIPEETEQDLHDILLLLDKIKATIVCINTFIPYPGTEICEMRPGIVTIKDYPNLMEDPSWLIKTYPKFRFANHQVDLQSWGNFYTKKYNKFWANLQIYFQLIYLMTLLHSQNKTDYLKQSRFLIREFMNQKLGI